MRFSRRVSLIIFVNIRDELKFILHDFVSATAKHFYHLHSKETRTSKTVA